MRAGFRQAMPVGRPPVDSLGMFAVEVESVDIGGFAGRNADQWAGIPTPEISEYAGIASGIPKAVRGCRALVAAAGEALPAAATECECGSKRMGDLDRSQWCALGRAPRRRALLVGSTD